MKNIHSEKYRNKAAFTLVEVMVGIMLTTIVLTSIYLVWSRVQRGIQRSHTRQVLQNEMRNIANYMQNDFKSIKYDEETFSLSEGDNGNFTMSFDKFKEVGENEEKLTSDSVEKVTYTLKNSMLTRSGNNTKILSVHCDGVNIVRSSETSTGDTELEDFDEDFKAAREAKLDIEITGRMTVKGTGEEMYHVEKTSVVMRNEYSKNVNKTFVSTFDLTKKDLSEVVVAGDASSLQIGNGVLDLEYLKTLNDDVLSGMLSSQNDMLKSTLEQLERLNDAIDDTDTGEGALEKFGDWLAFWSEDDGEKVRNYRDKLADAESKSDVEAAQKEIKKYTDEKEEEFLKNSVTGYDKMTQQQKDIYKKAYDMKVQDRNIKGAHDKQVENAKEGETIEEPKYVIDTLKGNSNAEEYEIIGKDGQKDTALTSASNEMTEENKAVVAAYEEINLDWMGEFGEEKEEVGAYNAAKSLLTQADTKLDVINMRDNCLANIDNIGKAMKEN